MPLPKRRHSKQRGRKRRTHYVATAPALVDCLHCGEKKLFHHICPACGYYRGTQITAGKEK
ncbi:MAG: 50S ribosomal protein L32 [candidate division Zixibacteria bacterium]|nr:50S ribosomal protein L32 [candidate division Zixibacteria bacterium]